MGEHALRTRQLLRQWRSLPPDRRPVVLLPFAYMDKATREDIRIRTYPPSKEHLRATFPRIAAMLKKFKATELELEKAGYGLALGEAIDVLREFVKGKAREKFIEFSLEELGKLMEEKGLLEKLPEDGKVLAVLEKRYEGFKPGETPLVVISHLPVILSAVLAQAMKIEDAVHLYIGIPFGLKFIVDEKEKLVWIPGSLTPAELREEIKKAYLPQAEYASLDGAIKAKSSSIILPTDLWIFSSLVEDYSTPKFWIALPPEERKLLKLTKEIVKAGVIKLAFELGLPPFPEMLSLRFAPYFRGIGRCEEVVSKVVGYTVPELEPIKPK